VTAPENRVTRWCPAHDGGMVKRGTMRCRRCRVDLKLSLTRPRPIVAPELLKPMRRRDGHTKRSIERITKGYVS
jgi:hypothetical protein